MQNNVNFDDPSLAHLKIAFHQTWKTNMLVQNKEINGRDVSAKQKWRNFVQNDHADMCLLLQFSRRQNAFG